MMYFIVPALLLGCWLTISISEQRSIFRQWLGPGIRRVSEFFYGLIFSMILCLLTQLFLSWINGVSWNVSRDLSLQRIVFSTLYDLNSVVAEEILFRGIILYFLIRYLTWQAALIIAASAFGIYHWFSFGVLGNPMAMTLVFAVTGLMGYVFGVAYVKTQSIILPIGIHFGWNWSNNTIFSNGPNGVQLLEPHRIAPANELYDVFSVSLYVFIPLLILLFVKSRIIIKQA